MKLAVITNGNFFARLELARLFKERHKDISGVIVITGVKKGKSRFCSVMEILGQSGWRYFVYKLSTYLGFAAAEIFFPKRAFFIPSFAKRCAIPVMYAAQVNRPSVIKQLRTWEPDVLISVSCPQRIGKEVLSVPKGLSINIHSSMLPKYAGIAPYVWVLANQERSTGTTVHVMEETFDTGKIIVQKRLAIRRKETVFSLFLRLCQLGSDALAEAVHHLTQGTARFTDQDLTEYTYFSWPKPDTIQSAMKNGHGLFSVSDFLRAIQCVD